MKLLLCFMISLNVLSATMLYLKDDNFDEEAPKHTVLFANFFHPECVHSQNLDAEFTQAEKQLSALKLPVSFAKVNCDGNGKKICEKLEIKAYPVIKVFNFGEHKFNYEGPKKAESMVKFLRFKLEAGSQKVSNLDELSACMADFDNVIIGFFHDSEGPLVSTFQQLAESFKADYKFAHTFSNKLVTMFGYRDDIVLFRSNKLKTTLEQSQIRFEEKPTLYNLRNWIAKNYQGLAGFRTKKNIEQFKAPLVVAYFHANFESQSSSSVYYRNRMIMAARKFQKGQPGVRDKVMFAVSDFEEFSRDLEEFGVKKIPQGRDAILVTMRDASQKKYRMDLPFSSEAVEQFVMDVFDRKVSPFIKSQEVSEEEEGEEETNVLTAVGTTFEKLVLDEEVDVLVQLFAPWSSDCKNALKIIKKVAKKLKQEETVRVVKIDITSNEVPQSYVIRGYPSVYLARRHHKEKPLFYEGAQTVKEYVSFIAANSTFPLKNYDRSGEKISSTKSTKVPVKTEL